MMYGGEYMKKDKHGKAHEKSEDEGEKYREYGCAGPSTTLLQILATDKKGK
jgi:hypothetical protein